MYTMWVYVEVNKKYNNNNLGVRCWYNYNSCNLSSGTLVGVNVENTRAVEVSSRGQQ